MKHHLFSYVCLVLLIFVGMVAGVASVAWSAVLIVKSKIRDREVALKQNAGLRNLRVLARAD